MIPKVIHILVFPGKLWSLVGLVCNKVMVFVLLICSNGWTESKCSHQLIGISGTQQIFLCVCAHCWGLVIRRERRGWQDVWHVSLVNLKNLNPPRDRDAYLKDTGTPSDFLWGWCLEDRLAQLSLHYPRIGPLPGLYPEPRYSPSVPEARLRCRC